MLQHWFDLSVCVYVFFPQAKLQIYRAASVSIFQNKSYSIAHRILLYIFSTREHVCPLKPRVQPEMQHAGMNQRLLKSLY